MGRDLAWVRDVRGVVRLEGLQRIKLSRGMAGAIVELDPWRPQGGEPQPQPLRLCLRAHYRALDAVVKKLRDLRVVSAQVRYDPDQGMGEPLSPLQPASDAELLQLLPLAPSAISIVDETFGLLDCDRAHGRCRGAALWQGRSIAVIALTDATLNPTPALKTLKQAWSQPQAVQRLIRERAAAMASLVPGTGDAESTTYFRDAKPIKVCADSHGNFAFFFTPEGSNLTACFRGHVADLAGVEVSARRRTRV